jgi:hypothetical protein
MNILFAIKVPKLFPDKNPKDESEKPQFNFSLFAFPSNFHQKKIIPLSGMIFFIQYSKIDYGVVVAWYVIAPE